MTAARTGRRPGWRLLAGLLAAAGGTHLVRPQLYRPLIPPALGDPDPWVLWSGVAELACAAALVPRRTRRPAALAAAALFVAVYPGNLQQAVDAHRRRSRPPVRIATLVRLPMQVPLVWWALAVARRARDSAGTARAAGWARKPAALWELSQKGLRADRPQRQRATVRRRRGSGAGPDG